MAWVYNVGNNVYGVGNNLYGVGNNVYGVWNNVYGVGNGVEQPDTRVYPWGEKSGDRVPDMAWVTYMVWVHI